MSSRVDRSRFRTAIRRFPNGRPPALTSEETGKVTRHDRIEVLHWEPGVRYVALVTYLPPAEPVTIVYNVDLKESGGITHFVMDSYSTAKLKVEGTESERVAGLAAGLGLTGADTVPARSIRKTNIGNSTNSNCCAPRVSVGYPPLE